MSRFHQCGSGISWRNEVACNHSILAACQRKTKFRTYANQKSFFQRLPDKSHFEVSTGLIISQRFHCHNFLQGLDIKRLVTSPKFAPHTPRPFQTSRSINELPFLGGALLFSANSNVRPDLLDCDFPVCSLFRVMLFFCPSPLHFSRSKFISGHYMDEALYVLRSIKKPRMMGHSDLETATQRHDTEESPTHSKVPRRSLPRLDDHVGDADVAPRKPTNLSPLHVLH